MDLDKDTWEIINSYFRDTPNYLVRHHIDSYNDFIKEKIPLIFKNINHLKVFRFDKEDNNITYLVNVYFGGKNADKFKISKPTIYDYNTGEMKQMYPNEARLKNLTYGFDFYYDIDIEFTIKEGNNVIVENEPINDNYFLKNIYLGKIPIMLKSDLCSVKGFKDDALTELGECKYDPGGYFIIDGREKVIVSQERKAENTIFLTTKKNSNDKYTHVAEVKSISSKAFTYSRTIKLQLEKSGAITVRLGQDKPFLQEVNGRDVPLFIVFRVLGIESDKDIINFILGDLDNRFNEDLAKLLIPSITDPYILKEEIYDTESAENYLEKLPSRAVAESKDKFSEIHNNKLDRLSLLYQALNENLLPHCGNDFINKAHYLAYMTKKLLLHKLNIEPETDRDSLINKRVDISGFMLATLFRDAIQQLKRNARVEIERKYEFNFKEYSGANFTLLVNEVNYREIFNYEVFKKYFTDSLKIGTIGTKEGVVQSLDRVNYYSFLSHLRRIIDPAKGSQVTIAERRLHSSQYGSLCPMETPEGQNVGLQKGLAVLAHITFGNQIEPILNFLYENKTYNLSSLTISEIHKMTKVFVNGNIVGYHNNPKSLVNIFRLYRRNGLINIFIGISWNIIDDEIKINTDNGRLVRPLYIIENNKINLEPKHISDILSNKIKFDNLLYGFRERKNKYNYYSSNIESLSNIGFNIKNKNEYDINEYLQDGKGIIEYLDVIEFNECMLSKTFNIDFNDKLNYTHVELSPSMFLGICAHLVPFINYTAAPRGIFSSKQIKQAVSTYATNFKNRFDTSSHILHNPEKPLIMGKLHNILNNDKIGTGHNVIVAITCYNGYNQEDAIIGNKTSTEMGLFNSTYFKMYEEVEKVDKKTNSSELLYNPKYRKENVNYPEDLEGNLQYNYNNLNKHGIIKEGTYLNDNDVLVGKYGKYVNDKGEEEYFDMSKLIKKDNVNSVVDKVYTCPINSSGDRLVKVRTAQYRYPQIGDKFASRCAQKGTYGILLNKEDMPYTEDGIVPDLIIHPTAYPKRMTINQLIEILYGNLTTELGFIGTGSPMESVSPKEINDILCDKLGFSYYGTRTLYNGISGEQMDTKIFTGVMYYQRLKYMVNDKINSRASGHRENNIPVPGGAYTFKERQSVSGRANGGGLRIGEMERDAILSHGMVNFLKESHIERCDKFIIYVSRKSGNISFVNPYQKICFDAESDGPVSYQLEDGIQDTEKIILGLNTENNTIHDYVKLVVPYSFKLLIQELQGLLINVKFNVNKIDIAIDRSDLINETFLEINQNNVIVDNELIQNDDNEDEVKDNENEELKTDNFDDDLQNEDDLLIDKQIDNYQDTNIQSGGNQNIQNNYTLQNNNNNETNNIQNGGKSVYFSDLNSNKELNEVNTNLTEINNIPLKTEIVQSGGNVNDNIDNNQINPPSNSSKEDMDSYGDDIDNIGDIKTLVGGGKTFDDLDVDLKINDDSFMNQNGGKINLSNNNLPNLNPDIRNSHSQNDNIQQGGIRNLSNDNTNNPNIKTVTIDLNINNTDSGGNLQNGGGNLQNGGSNLQNGGGNLQNGGGNTNNSISFNDNIKQVNIDSYMGNDGNLYSNEKIPNPF